VPNLTELVLTRESLLSDTPHVRRVCDAVPGYRVAENCTVALFTGLEKVSSCHCFRL
jgi:hypothetical protein